MGKQSQILKIIILIIIFSGGHRTAGFRALPETARGSDRATAFTPPARAPNGPCDSRLARGTQWRVVRTSQLRAPRDWVRRRARQRTKHGAL